MQNNQNQKGGGNQNQNQKQNINEDDYEPIDAKNIFINEIRNRIEAYFKLIVRNLRDSIPKIIGNNLVKSIEDNMQIELYNQLYKSNEMVGLLNEPEHIAERRKDLTELIRVMRNAQKVIRRDPDLMTVMQININDSDIHPGSKNEKPVKENPIVNNQQNLPKNNVFPNNINDKAPVGGNKGNFNNLFGTVKK